MVGFTIGAASQNQATAASLPPDLHLYTHETDSGLGSQHVDPINVIFTHHGFNLEITQQADNHGGWEVQTTRAYLRLALTG